MPGMDGFINFNGTLNGSIAGGGGGDVTDVKVRNSQESTFESVVNEQGVAEIDLISYVRRNELTQAIENVENSIDNVEKLVDTKQNKYDYSTTPVDTGQKWIDGKSIYSMVIMLDNRINVSNNYSTIIGNISSYNPNCLISANFYDNNGGSDYNRIRTINNANMELIIANNGDVIVNYSGTSNYTQFIGCEFKFTVI